MTSPTATTTSYPLTPGQPAQLITDGGNVPTGLQLVNPGNNGGTVWIMAGPAGQAAAVPLGPGASLQWTDTAANPYAYLSTAATHPETLVVTSQAQGYTNPITVAGALITQGIPSTMLDTGYGSYQVGPNGATAPISVAVSSTLVVAVSWPQPAPVGCGVVTLTFTDPAQPDLPPIVYTLTADNAVSQDNNVWRVPVVAPYLTVRNLQTPDNNNAPAYVSIVGNNRPAPARIEQLGETEPGAHQLWAPTTAAGTYVLQGGAYATGPASPSPAAYAVAGSRVTRLNGSCTAAVWLGAGSASGFLYQLWVNAQGRVTAMAYALTTGISSVQIAHPPVPCWWLLNVNAGQAGAVSQVALTQN